MKFDDQEMLGLQALGFKISSDNIFAAIGCGDARPVVARASAVRRNTLEPAQLTGFPVAPATN
jgi:hypothetical protein